jgi:thiamine biosynthesis protein ThiS
VRDLSATTIPKLVVVTNRHTARYSLPDLAQRALAGGADVVQIREKDLEERALFKLTHSVLAAVVDPARVMINGSVEIARRLGIGLHLPEGANKPSETILSELTLVGRSVHTQQSAIATEWADFLIAGHVFPTRSKPGRPPIGVDGLGKITNSVTIPVIAIGGMTLERVGNVLAAGAAGIAVLSAINDSDDPEAAARGFKSTLEAAMSNTQTTVDVTVNGKQVTIPSGQTIHGYLASRGFHDRMVVVELNGQIIRRAAFDTATISAGDRIEIVHFVGGG